MFSWAYEIPNWQVGAILSGGSVVLMWVGIIFIRPFFRLLFARRYYEKFSVAISRLIRATGKCRSKQAVGPPNGSVKPVLPGSANEMGPLSSFELEVVRQACQPLAPKDRGVFLKIVQNAMSRTRDLGSAITFARSEMLAGCNLDD
jgi:hypothetical protein